MLSAMLNMTAFHHEHEKFYSAWPLEQAVLLHRHARTLHALADRWATAEPRLSNASNPYEGAPELNDPAALQLEGVLFMEGEGEPGEIGHLKRDLRNMADDSAGAGDWLGNAMQAAWEVASTLFDIDGLADLLGERHRIITNDWHGALIMVLTARVLNRAADLLDRIDFTPAALRADLNGQRLSAQRLSSAAEMIDAAADMFSTFAGLVHDNERRWRVFRARVQEIAAALEAQPADEGSTEARTVADEQGQGPD